MSGAYETKRFTKFEKAKLLAARVAQLSAGAEPRVPLDGDYDPISIAKREFAAGLSTLVVLRKGLDGQVQAVGMKDVTTQEW